MAWQGEMKGQIIAVVEHITKGTLAIQELHTKFVFVINNSLYFSSADIRIRAVSGVTVLCIVIFFSCGLTVLVVQCAYKHTIQT
jgi:hypothetical protein